MGERLIERQFRWAGYQPGMLRAYLRGDTVVPIDKSEPPYWFHNRYNNQLVLSSRHLREPCVDALIAEFARFKPFMLQAYPSTAYELASLLEKRNASLKIPCTSSRPPSRRIRISGSSSKNDLGGRVMEYYGMAERVAYASECERGNLHVNTDYSYVEIVDDDGQPTSGDGYIVGDHVPQHRDAARALSRFGSHALAQRKLLVRADVSARRADHRKV